MRANKVGALVILAVLLALVCLASPLAGANPPAEQGVRVAASVAPLLQYQGRLLDAPTGDPVADGTHVMVFRIYNVETEGAALWTETKDVPVENGLFSTVLGDTTALDQALFDNGQALWLGVKVGADAEATPRQPLLPVAYALGLAPGAVIDVDNADVADGALSPAKITGTAWTGTNDGAGSGLNADLLDSQQASAFASSSHTHTGTDIADGTVTSADIEDFSRTIGFPANALNYEAAGSYITQFATGLTWQFHYAQPAYLTIPRPADWDGTSDVIMHLYFVPTTNTTGYVQFFIRPRAKDPGDYNSDASSIADDPVYLSGSYNIVQEQVISIPASSFGSKALWIIAMQRDGSEATYPDDITLLSVALDYKAVR